MRDCRWGGKHKRVRWDWGWGGKRSCSRECAWGSKRGCGRLGLHVGLQVGRQAFASGLLRAGVGLHAGLRVGRQA